MIDHLVYATPDLQSSVDDLNGRLGVRLTPGGRHIGLGTRNFLADLGDRTYLEVLGPDLDQPKPEGERPLGIDDLTRPRLATWAARVEDLDKTVQLASAHGYMYDPVVAMSRDREDGTRLEWRVSVPTEGQGFGGVIPFLIQWDSGAYAAELSTKGIRLVSFSVFYPHSAIVRRYLDLLGLADNVTVQQADEPSLLAVLTAPMGEVELR